MVTSNFRPKPKMAPLSDDWSIRRKANVDRCKVNRQRVSPYYPTLNEFVCLFKESDDRSDRSWSNSDAKLEQSFVASGRHAIGALVGITSLCVVNPRGVTLPQPRRWASEILTVVAFCK